MNALRTFFTDGYCWGIAIILLIAHAIAGTCDPSWFGGAW